MSAASFTATGGAQTFQATNGGYYRITAFGAAGGGSANGGIGGQGAEVEGEFDLAPGTILSITVGAAGHYGAGAGGGGGGTFVVETFDGTAPTRTALLVAGGGGGSGDMTGAQGSGGVGYAVNGAGGGYGGAGAAGAGGGGGGGYTGGGGGAAGQPGSAGTAYRAGQPDDGAAGTNGGAGGYGGGGSGGFDGGGGGGGGYGGGNGGSAGATPGDESGGGGGSLDRGMDALLTAQVNSGAGKVMIAPLCFVRGTRILTPTGEVPVERLRIGEPVVTRFGGICPIRWIGFHDHEDATGSPELSPVCLRAGALGAGMPARDLRVSPGHSVLVGDVLVLARLLVNGVTVVQDPSEGRVSYFHIELDAHDCVIAEGAWAETFANAQTARARFTNAAEFDLLYPDAGPAPDAFVLCAPRPEGGPPLRAALCKVAALAARGREIAPSSAAPMQRRPAAA